MKCPSLAFNVLICRQLSHAARTIISISWTHNLRSRTSDQRAGTHPAMDPRSYLSAVASTNEKTVRANNAAFSARDVDGMLKLHAPDAAVFDRRPIGWGEFHGHDALRSYYQGLFDNADELDEELEVVSEEDGTVVASCHLRARLAGQEDREPVTFDYALRIRLEAGVIAEVQIHDDAEAAGASPR